MICCQYSSSGIRASDAIPSVPHIPIVHVSSPAFSFSWRHCTSGRSARWARIIFCGSASRIARGSRSAHRNARWSTWSTRPRW